MPGESQLWRCHRFANQAGDGALALSPRISGQFQLLASLNNRASAGPTIHRRLYRDGLDSLLDFNTLTVAPRLANEVAFSFLDDGPELHPWCCICRTLVVFPSSTSTSHIA